MASAMKAWSLNHRTAREVPKYLLLFKRNTFSTGKKKKSEIKQMLNPKIINSPIYFFFTILPSEIDL